MSLANKRFQLAAEVTADLGVFGVRRIDTTAVSRYCGEDNINKTLVHGHYYTIFPFYINIWLCARNV